MPLTRISIPPIIAPSNRQLYATTNAWLGSKFSARHRSKVEILVPFSHKIFSGNTVADKLLPDTKKYVGIQKNWINFCHTGINDVCVCSNDDVATDINFKNKFVSMSTRLNQMFSVEFNAFGTKFERFYWYFVFVFPNWHICCIFWQCETQMQHCIL